MSDSSVLKFIDALKSDPALKQRVIQAQREATTDIRREADAIVAVARELGFDLGEWAKRPTDGKFGSSEARLECSLTCCLVATSTL
jgi:hypothetical protein